MANKNFKVRQGLEAPLIAADDGTTAITLTGANVAVAGTLAVTGTATIGDDSRTLGEHLATRSTTWTPPATPLTTLTGLNGFSTASSTGYGPVIQAIYYSGDTTAGTTNSAAFIGRGAAGTNTAPSAVGTNTVMSTFNYDGYGTTDFASQLATTNQGAGATSVFPLQAQGYSRQTFADSAAVSTTVTGASGTGSTATLTFTTQNTAPYVVGQTVAIAGMTPSGYNNAAAVITAATTSSISYANATTGFTSGGTITAPRTVTAAGMGFRVRGFANSTNLSVANRFNFMDLNATNATFKSGTYNFINDVITGSTLTATTYMQLTSAGHTLTTTADQTTFIRNSGANTGPRPVASLRNTQTVTAAPATGDGSTFRQSVAGSNGTVYNLTEISGVYSSTGDTSISLSVANGDQTTSIMTSVAPFTTRLGSTTIRGTATPSATAGANTLTDIATFTNASTAIKSDTITLESSAGTDYAVLSSTSAKFATPVRTTITSATVAKGGTFTPAVTAMNSIILEVTAGSGTTTIDVSNLTVTGENAVFDIMVYNNSGGTINSNALVILNSGNTALDHGSSISNGARAMFEVNCVDIYANAKYAGDAV